MRSQSRSQAAAEIADRVKSILETRNLTIHEVSQKSESLFGHTSAHFLPHNLYYELRLGTFTPSLQQLFALSKITDYTITDWLHAFGLDLENIPRLQLLLAMKRTIILDSDLMDLNAFVPWFRNRSTQHVIPAVAPLTQLLQIGPLVPQSALLPLTKKSFLYVKIGFEDAMAFPDLVPGSIVRIDPERTNDLTKKNGTASKTIFLVEHANGICCCRLLPGRNTVRLLSAQLPYAQVEFGLDGREARILGAADLEIRPLTCSRRPEIPKALATRWKPQPLIEDDTKLSRIMRAKRMNMALSLREASELSERIATILDDDRYFISASTLSDYEARDKVPRQVHKVLSLCVLYNIHFGRFLDQASLEHQRAGKQAIPDRIMWRLRSPQRDIQIDTSHLDLSSGFLGTLIKTCEDIPVFVKGAIREISCLRSASPRSFFWTGGAVRNHIHPYLRNSIIVSIDRRRKRPVDSRSLPLWKQRLYLVLKRDGGYICGPCGIEDGTLVIHPDTKHLELREEFRNQRDAEVIGHVCAVMRKL